MFSCKLFCLSTRHPTNIFVLRILLAVLCPLTSVYAQQPEEEIDAVPNRPTFSTTAETVQRGVLEIEGGFEAASGLQDVNLLLKFGLLKDLEVRVGNDPLLRVQGSAGVSDTGVGFKYRFFEQHRRIPTTSILYTAILPSATSGLGIGAMGHSLALLLSKDLGKHHFDFNEAIQFIGRGPGGSGFRRSYFSALAYSHPLGEKWGITGEVAGTSRLDPSTGETMTLLGALTYSKTPRLVFDFGAYGATLGDIPTVVIFSGVTYSIADLYYHHHIAGAKR